MSFDCGRDVSTAIRHGSRRQHFGPFGRRHELCNLRVCAGVRLFPECLPVLRCRFNVGKAALQLVLDAREDSAWEVISVGTFDITLACSPAVEALVLSAQKLKLVRALRPDGIDNWLDILSTIGVEDPRM